jgi:Flp pilus assembly protein TadG
MTAASFRFLPRLGTDGGAAAEFALIVPVLLLLIVGIFEFGRAYWIQNNLQFAAEEAGRWVMVNSSPVPSTATVHSHFNTKLVAVNAAAVTFTTSTAAIPGVVPGTQALVINATYTFTFLPALSNLVASFPGGGGLPVVTLRGRSVAPLN